LLLNTAYVIKYFKYLNTLQHWQLCHDT